MIEVNFNIDVEGKETLQFNVIKIKEVSNINPWQISSDSETYFSKDSESWD